MLAIFAVALRRAVAVASGLRGAALGAAAGAWGGLAVFAFCPSGETQHLLVGHVLPVALFTVGRWRSHWPDDRPGRTLSMSGAYTRIANNKIRERSSCTYRPSQQRRCSPLRSPHCRRTPIGPAKAKPALVIATGNTETKTANAKLQLANEIGKWKHQFGGTALYASSDDEGTTARALGSLRADGLQLQPAHLLVRRGALRRRRVQRLRVPGDRLERHRPQVHRHRRHQVHRHGRRRLQVLRDARMRSTTPAC